MAMKLDDVELSWTREVVMAIRILLEWNFGILNRTLKFDEFFALIEKKGKNSFG